MPKLSLDDIAFYTSIPTIKFSGIENDPSTAKVLILGVPFDSTSSRLPGSRLAPKRIREASWELESYNPYAGKDLEELPIADLGDVNQTTNFDQLYKMMKRILEKIDLKDKILFTIGGEHTISYPILDYMLSRYNVDIFVFDAHLDIRDEYPVNDKITHATVFRRIHEKYGPKIYYYKPRAFSKEEYEYVSRQNTIMLIKDIDELIKPIKKTNSLLYISIDIDAIDPSFAPAVGNPEPLGLHPKELIDVIDLITRMGRQRIVGLDLVEVNPLVDVNDITSFLAAKIIQETIFKLF